MNSVNTKRKSFSTRLWGLLVDLSNFLSAPTPTSPPNPCQGCRQQRSYASAIVTFRLVTRIPPRQPQHLLGPFQADFTAAGRRPESYSSTPRKDDEIMKPIFDSDLME
jgi:hypothetical protein